MYFCKNTSLLTGCCSTHITSTGARTGIGRFDKRFLKVSDACQTSYDARPDKSYDLNFKQKSSGARLMCANADRAPYGARPMSVYPQ